MTDPTVTAARRYSELHSGFHLVAAVEAAIPISWLTLDLVALERKPLPVVDEFVLRLCQQGVNTIPDIAAVLGIEDDVVRNAVAGQLSAETLDYSLVHQLQRRGVPTIRLTAAGEKSVVELGTTTPQRVEQHYAFDRLRWIPTEHTKADVITRDEAQTAGAVLLPTSHTREVTAQDVSPRTLNTLITDSEIDRERAVAPARNTRASALLEILAVEAVTRQPRRYLPAVLLVFSAIDFQEVRLSVVVDDLVSEQHGQALLKAGGTDNLGIIVVDPVGEPELPAELVAQRAPYNTVRGLQRRADNTVPGGSALSADAPASDSATARAELSALTVRAVPVFEHREFLAHALRETRRRLLLVTPHIHDAVIDTEFCSQLETLLRRRRFVAHIAYGSSQFDREHGKKAINRLSKLGERFSNLTVIRLEDPRPPCFIFDDSWINSSFGWLSFRGGPERIYRREEGTLIRATDVVNDKYSEVLSAIE
ncbi:hypothetical protein IU450_13185 [Nocardia abscessus]|uniref:hypothetical protein n=1 Tax=Nocardia abscessus TaxID=120957 RepID=UPI001892F2EE|nr:hypothetical protein [Nocardia abscessus]MBF6336839.1 hypothetical protein [Nocardia abscessus]